MANEIDIFAQLVPPADPPPAPDPLATKKANTAKLAAQLVADGYTGVTKTHNALIALVNDNPYKLTPSQAAASLGTRGAALLGLAVKVQELAAQIGQVTGRDVAKDLTPPKDGVTYTPQSDGSIAVTEA